MSPQQAVAESRRAHGRDGVRWAAPLVAYLNDPPSEGRVFGWLCSCVGDLLDHLGKSSIEIDDALSSARRQAAAGVDRDAVEQLAWAFWSRRTGTDPTFTAVAQLLFALSRSDCSRPFDLAGSCSTPIRLLESLESRRGEVLDLVIAHFSAYVAGETA